MKDDLDNKLNLSSLKLRDKCLRIANSAGDNAAHIGGALSCIDFIACVDELYNISKNNESLRSIILSKGHACLALYALISKQGVISIDEIVDSFERDGSRFLGHPSRNLNLGIQFSTGSLGNGLAHAAGKALFMETNYAIWVARVQEERQRTQNATNQLIEHSYNHEFLDFVRGGSTKPGIVRQMDQLDLEKELEKNQKKNWKTIDKLTQSMQSDHIEQFEEFFAIK